MPERAEVFQCTGSESPNEQLVNAMRAALLILVAKDHSGSLTLDTHYAIGIEGTISFNTQTGMLWVKAERK